MNYLTFVKNWGKSDKMLKKCKSIGGIFMRKITKLFAGLLASAMVLTMSTAVFASAEEKTSTSTYTDHETVTIQKKYKLTNEGTISPAETFT